MTVGELIRALSAYPSDMKVSVADHIGDLVEATEVKLYEGSPNEPPEVCIT